MCSFLNLRGYFGERLKSLADFNFNFGQGSGEMERLTCLGRCGMSVIGLKGLECKFGMKVQAIPRDIQSIGERKDNAILPM